MQYWVHEILIIRMKLLYYFWPIAWSYSVSKTIFSSYLIYPIIIYTVELVLFSMVVLENHLDKCARVRALVSWNPRPTFYTVNTTQDSRNREKPLTKTMSKRILSAGLVALKNQPRYYKDPFLHLKDALLRNGEMSLCPARTWVRCYHTDFRLQSTLCCYRNSQTDMTLKLSVLWSTTVDWICTLSLSEDPNTLRKILELRYSHSAWRRALIARSSLLQRLCIRWRTISCYPCIQTWLVSAVLNFMLIPS